MYISFREHGRPSIEAVDFLGLQQTLLAYGLMAATIPCLRGFLGRFRTGDLARLTESEIMHSDGAKGMGVAVKIQTAWSEPCPNIDGSTKTRQSQASKELHFGDFAT